MIICKWWRISLIILLETAACWLGNFPTGSQLWLWFCSFLPSHKLVASWSSTFLCWWCCSECWRRTTSSHLTCSMPHWWQYQLLKIFAISSSIPSTVFPRNLAAARFYFKAPFGAATIRGRLNFKGGVYRDRYARTYTASHNDPIYARKMSVHIRKLLSTPYQRGEISRAAFIGTSWQINAATFRGRRDFEVRRDFEEIR